MTICVNLPKWLGLFISISWVVFQWVVIFFLISFIIITIHWEIDKHKYKIK